ncbi:MAG: hypothetical protein JKY89_08200 [Immundisolibacteraceae bacterium]|nr:hypothetical protein [Immundisolibacteraceae bacterium]
MSIKENFKNAYKKYIEPAVLTSVFLASGAVNTALAQDNNGNTRGAYNDRTAPTEMNFTRKMLPSKGYFRDIDLTGNNATSKIKRDGPQLFSDDFLALVVRGGNKDLIAATKNATKTIAVKLHDAAHMIADDEDHDPNTVKISIYANGRFVKDVDNITNLHDQKYINRTVMKELIIAYRTDILPHLVNALTKKTDNQTDNTVAAVTRTPPAME